MFKAIVADHAADLKTLVTVFMHTTENAQENAMLEKRAENWQSTKISDESNEVGEPIAENNFSDAAVAAAEFANERRQLLEQLELARQETAHVRRSGDELLSLITHELRTPLTALLGWTQMLLDDKLDRTMQQRAFQIIHRNAQTQNKLIEDLLDASRILKGKLEIQPQRFSLHSVVTAAVAAATPLAAAKHLTIQSFVDENFAPLYADPQRLKQILCNLLSNAIKFTPKNGEVRIDVQEVDEFAEIAVHDTGVGIKPDALEKIFDCDWQIAIRPNRKTGGLGLGLPIAKHLVERHGGTISAESAGENQGATFKLKMPLDLATATRRAANDEILAGDSADQVH